MITKCPHCRGGGYDLLRGDLGATHTYPKRPFVYNPGLRRLIVWRKGHPEAYRIGEFRPEDVAGESTRAFEVLKESDQEVYHVRVGTDGAVRIRHCDCRGRVSESTRHASLRWHHRKDRVPETLGCIHLDAVSFLLAAGALDVPLPITCESETSFPDT